jgi:hypothetical protein
MRFRFSFLPLAVFLALFLFPRVPAHAEDIFSKNPRKTYTMDEDKAASWKENTVELPPYPQDADFYSFYVSPAAANRFYVDTAHIGLGSDGVARYTLLIISPSGIRNISHEGMRCATRERRTYALGRPNGELSPARGARWVPVREAVANRHHAALFQEFFCPDGLIASRPEEVVRAIRKDGEPLAR